MSAASDDCRWMARAIEIARHGMLDVSPNPMVGCVIVARGRIIGEGFHRRCGEGHAEVNAVASVADRTLLPEATVYVTLEPCSHYGKTPPCALLLRECGVRRVVVGCGDPNEKVNGRGVAMLRDAGIEVTCGVMEQECRRLNPHFMTAFGSGRPYVTLKWAQSADGFMDLVRGPGEPAYRFSTPLGRALVHRLRATHDAIMVGAVTDRMDSPALTTRHWAGRSPRRYVASGSLPAAELLERMRADGVTSVMVEGGPTLLRSFIDAGLWDEARVEIAPVELAGRGAARAPHIPQEPSGAGMADGNMVVCYRRQAD